MINLFNVLGLENKFYSVLFGASKRVGQGGLSGFTATSALGWLTDPSFSKPGGANGSSKTISCLLAHTLGQCMQSPAKSLNCRLAGKARCNWLYSTV